MENGAGIAPHQRPRFAYLHHISLPCRDLEESKRFYTHVFGNFPAAASFPRGIKQGGSYTTDYAGLYYDWRG
jgi:catechol 2,3-dioxygenase-like lactoylglutathione lyase family enzyme